MMNKICLMCMVLALGGWAQSTISNVEMVANAEGTFYTISYEMSGDSGIVSLDILTNGISVASGELRRVGGDVNRVVTAGKHQIWWRPNRGSVVVSEVVKPVVKVRAVGNPPDYMVMSLRKANVRWYYESEDALPWGIDSDYYRTGSLLMRRVKATGKTFTMGSAASEPCRDTMNREDAHTVAFTTDYWLAVFEFTQGQWASIDRKPGNSGVERCYHYSYFTNGVEALVRPVDCIWQRALRGAAGKQVWGFMDFLNTRVGLTDNTCGFDLPCEAEWEFACRAGTSTSLYDGTYLTASAEGEQCVNLDRLARYAANGGSESGTARVGSYMPNAWGFYDMLGNVFELCVDSYVVNLGTDLRYASTVNYPQSYDGASCVARGGMYYGKTYYNRVSQRVAPYITGSFSNNDALTDKINTAKGYGFRPRLAVGK